MNAYHINNTRFYTYYKTLTHILKEVLQLNIKLQIT
jgi:hypothetical protein